MKLKWLGIILFIISNKVSKCQNFPVTFTIQQYIPYCGGAAPEKEYEQKDQVSQPYANKILYIVNHKGKKTGTVTSNTKGVFNLNFKTTGTYSLFEPWKYLKTGVYGDTISNYDANCLSKEWKKPDIVINVSKSGTKVKSFIPETALCFWHYPCVLHREMPPAAKPH